MSTGNFNLHQNERIFAETLVEGAQDALTAHAGGGQANALALTKGVNRISTVATAGDSVALPTAVPGLEIVVINSGTKPMQVFGSGTDTINEVATATGVSQMQASLVIYTCAVAGKWHTDGLGTGFSASFPTVSAVDALTAHAGGGQASGTPLTAVLNRFTTVATAADSATLPVSAPGMQVTVINATAATSMNVFPATGDTINALGANNAFAVAGTKVATFYCTVAGQWHTILTA